MLIQKKAVLANGDVAAIKLVTGEEIVGRVVEVGVGSISLTKPVVLQMQMVGPSDARLAFAPFMTGTDEGGTFVFDFAKCLVSPLRAREDVAGGYLQATTGLVAPPKNGLIV